MLVTRIIGTWLLILGLLATPEKAFFVLTGQRYYHENAVPVMIVGLALFLAGLLLLVLPAVHRARKGEPLSHSWHIVPIVVIACSVIVYAAVSIASKERPSPQLTHRQTAERFPTTKPMRSSSPTPWRPC